MTCTNMSVLVTMGMELLTGISNPQDSAGTLVSVIPTTALSSIGTKCQWCSRLQGLPPASDR